MDKKTLWLIANWKSNKTISEALEWISSVGPKVERRDDLKVVICPTFSALSEVKKAVQVGNYPLIVGSQDLSPFDSGAYTGEEAASILKQFIDIAIVGHSERRENFSETDEMVSKKVTQAVDADITPLLCVQSAETPVPAQCKLTAYEPVFAIGTGNPDTPANANSVAAQLKQIHGQDLGVLYGGSVNKDNCRAFLEEDNISGLLIGKASLDAEEFVKIISACLE
ncbi:triosephosphate isomerase [Candidatus Daviesbacteria bacterium]|nr:triosephosphate isomerase [Candidatus Daviesbacteria bacterium]